MIPLILKNDLFTNLVCGQFLVAVYLLFENETLDGHLVLKGDGCPSGSQSCFRFYKARPVLCAHRNVLILGTLVSNLDAMFGTAGVFGQNFGDNFLYTSVQ